MQSAIETAAANVSVRRRWLDLLAGALILAAGAAIGSGVTVMWSGKRRSPRFPIMHRPAAAAERITERLSTDLRLTAAQKPQVKKLLEEHFLNMRKAHEEMKPRFRAEIDKLHSGVKKILSPEQAKEWEARFRDALWRAGSFPGRPRRGGKYPGHFGRRPPGFGESGSPRTGWPRPDSRRPGTGGADRDTAPR